MCGEYLPEGNMLGVYAARRYEGLEPITVYVGDILGKADGNADILIWGMRSWTH